MARTLESYVQARISTDLEKVFRDACRDAGVRPSEAIREMIEAYVRASHDRLPQEQRDRAA